MPFPGFRHHCRQRVGEEAQDALPPRRRRRWRLPAALLRHGGPALLLRKVAAGNVGRRRRRRPRAHVLGVDLGRPRLVERRRRQG